MSSKTLLPLVISLLVSPVYAATFIIEKNNQSFSIDGNGGAIEGQQIYLWGTNEDNVNQQWVQISHGDGYYSHKKEDTNLCWDGGDDGAKKQAVTLETCDSSNYDQHWEKVKITAGTEIYRFEKRNAPDWSIDGNGGGANGQSIYLWTSSDTNVNQQWDLTNIDESTSDSDDASYLQQTGTGLYYAVNSSGQLVSTASSTSDAQGFERVSNDGGISWKAIGGDYDGLYSYEPSGESRQVIGADLSDAEVFFETSCGGDDVYFTSDETGDNLKNESDNKLGNGSGGDCSDDANTFTWVGGSSESSGGNTDENSGETTIPTSITDSDLWDLEGDDPDPLVDPYTLEFVPLEAKVTTPNGNGWRHEYKIASDRRIAMTDTYEEFKATIKVDMSTGGKTIVAQHHAGDTGTIMKLYVADSSESGFDDSTASNGIFDVYVRIRNTEGVEEKKPLGTIKSGDSFSFEVINDYGLVKVSAFGENLETEVEDDSESYLKFGNYLQSQYPQGSEDCGESGDSDSFAECYDDIGITESKITMTNVSYTRIEK